jgi:mono/diheme cytochrome c family protein
MSMYKPVLLCLSTVLILVSCKQSPPAQESATTSSDEISAEQLEKGIGPITQVQLAEDVDDALARTGEQVFQAKCSACHKLNERYIGPPLFDVTSRRAPEYIMNMILNPTEMLQKHPTAKELLAQYNFTPMADQNLTEAEARAILEYLREAGEEAAEETEN